MTVPGRGAPTAADVAAVAGVSRSTVSFVLNGTPGKRIPDATRQRVVAAAAQLGYVVHSAASDLRRRSSRTVVGVLDERQANDMSLGQMPVFAEAMREVGLTMMVAVVSGPVSADLAGQWAAMRPPVVVAFSADLSAGARRLLRTSGCVLVGNDDADVLMTSDQAAIASAGAAALRGRGRRHLLQVLPGPGPLGRNAAPRVSAFAAAAGPDGLGTRHVAGDEEAIRGLVDEMASWPVWPDGIVAYDDDYAGSLLGALRDAGIGVPERTAILGAGDSPWSQRLRPRLSTLALDVGAAAQRLAAVVHAIVDENAYPRSLVIDPSPRPVHRGTT